MIEEINKWLRDNYGTTVTGKPLFRIIWSTNITEHRYSEFSDFYGDILVRTVREIREVLKYPFAQDRFVLERIAVISDKARELGLRSDNNEEYVEVYTFQDKEGNFLPVTHEMTETALFLFFRFFLGMSWKERTDMRMEMLAKRELERKQKTREALGEGRSPFGFVLGGRR